MATAFRPSPASRSAYAKEARSAQKSRGEREIAVELLRQRLPRVVGHCHWCLGQGELDDSHSTSKCLSARAEDRNWLSKKRTWKGQVKWEMRDVLCFMCWLPQHDHSFHPGSSHDKSPDSYGQCRYQDILPEMLYALAAGGHLDMPSKNFGVALDDVQEWQRWLVASAGATRTPNVWKAAVWMLEGLLGARDG